MATEREQEAKRLRDSGKTWAQVAEALGISPSSARNWVKRANARPVRPQAASGLPAELAGLSYRGRPLTSAKVEAMQTVLQGEILPKSLEDEYDDYLVHDARVVGRRMAEAQDFDIANFPKYLAAELAP